MTSTFRLAKYSLFAVGYIVLCSVLVIVKKHRNFATDHRFIDLSTDIHSTNVLRATHWNDSGENNAIFAFEDDSIVRLEDLNGGTEIGKEEVERKLRRIERTCEKYNKTSVLRRDHFLHSPKHRALYCWIRKVASTSFTKFFGDLRGRRAARNYYREIKFLAPRTNEELESFIDDEAVFKFLIVRHPFERLVSSYRDRIEDNSRYTAQAWIYAPRIFHLTRPELFRSNGTGGNGLQHIFNDDRRLKLIPTFDEFVTWLLTESPENDDVHWFQYHRHCSICSSRFDYVLKLDNYTRSDVNYILAKLGLREKLNYLPKLHSSPDGRTDFTTSCEYFASLPRERVLRLYERYRIDFEMFDYEYDDYLRCGATRETVS